MSDPPPRQVLIGRILEAGRAGSAATLAFHGAVAERVGLGASDHKALDVLVQHGPIPAGDLAERVGLAPGTVSALLDRLEAGGFARRRRDPDDRRRVLVEAAPEGLAPFGEMFGPFVEAYRALLEDYPDDVLRAHLDLTERTTEVLRQRAEALRSR